METCSGRNGLAPSGTREIDELKTSMLAERARQTKNVRFEKFSELEHALFAVDLILSDALKNADDVVGELKPRRSNLSCALA